MVCRGPEGHENKNLNDLILLTLFNYIMITRNCLRFVDDIIFFYQVSIICLPKKSERKTFLTYDSHCNLNFPTKKKNNHFSFILFFARGCGRVEVNATKCTVNVWENKDSNV